MIEVDAYKHRYSFREMYKILLNMFSSIPLLKRNKREQIIDKDFTERIMLAVTEVNGCAICSYAHTKMALESGFSIEEVESFFAGSDTYIKPEEAMGILFAQSYADNQGNYSDEAYQTLVDYYGEEKSKTILAAARGMMAGNVIGLPMSAISARFKGKKYSNSSFFYEIGMLLAPLLLIPISGIHSLFRRKSS